MRFIGEEPTTQPSQMPEEGVLVDQVAAELVGIEELKLGIDLAEHVTSTGGVPFQSSRARARG